MADTEIETPNPAIEKAVIEVWPWGTGWAAKVRGSLFTAQTETRHSAIRMASTYVVVEERPLGQSALFNQDWASQFYTVQEIPPPTRER